MPRGKQNRPQKAPTGGRFLPQGPLSRKREGGVWRGQKRRKISPGRRDLSQSARFWPDPVPCLLGQGRQRLNRPNHGPRVASAAAAKNPNLVASVSAAAIGLSLDLSLDIRMISA